MFAGGRQTLKNMCAPSANMADMADKRVAGTLTSRGYWRVRISVSDEYGRVKQKGFERKTLIAAQNAARVWERANGRLLMTEPASGTLKELFEYVDLSVWKKKGEQHQRAMNLYRAKWTEKLGEVPVADLTAPVLTRTMATMGLKSKSAIDKADNCIRQAMAYAVSDLGWLKTSPAETLRKPAPQQTGKTYAPITLDEYNRMLGLADERCKLLIRLTGECGLRGIEAKRVRPDHLESIRDRWIINVGKSKTAAGIRPVPCPDEIAQMIFARNDSDWKGISDPCDHLRKWWAENSKTRFYDLRGWYSDNLRLRGVPPEIRTKIMGHTKVNFTQEVYETITSKEVLDVLFPTETDSRMIVGQLSTAGEKSAV